MVDLLPDIPDFQRMQLPCSSISLEADTRFREISSAGRIVSKNDSMSAVLDDMFLISGFIPRETLYEAGLRRGI